MLPEKPKFLTITPKYDHRGREIPLTPQEKEARIKEIMAESVGLAEELKKQLALGPFDEETQEHYEKEGDRQTAISMLQGFLRSANDQVERLKPSLNVKKRR